MKIILNQTIAKLGKEGQVVKVADGFARNFLFPKKLARVADKTSLDRLEREQQKAAAETEKTRGNAEKLAAKIDGQTVRVIGSTAKGATKLFGAITSSDVAEAIKSTTGVEVDKRTVALLHPIKRLGVYNILVDLHRDVDAHIHLEVANQDGLLGIEEPVAQVVEGSEAAEAAAAGKGLAIAEEAPMSEEPAPIEATPAEE
ncbi:MAG: 50S ribosomal protein L9 [Armatimonadetes bacterium]|nr:50S ribosomal protein L9 [Armatimonadota bacterium]